MDGREIMSIHEIVLPETEPETEWILGRAVRKVSPYSAHAWLQRALVVALDPWAKGRGRVGTEWRFRVAPPAEIRRPLVPDVAYVSNERLRGLEGLDAQAPTFAPDLAIEILSPGDRSRHVEHKVAVYLAGGALLVVVVDPERREMTLHDARGARTLRGDDVLTHPSLPGFALPLPEFFAEAEPPR